MELYSILSKFFLKNIKLFAVSFVLTNIIAAVIYFSLDREYESQVKVLPSERANNVINLSSFGSIFPTSVIKDPRGGQIFSSIIKSKNFYEDLSSESVIVNGQNITIHNLLLEYYDLKVKKKNKQSNKNVHGFLLDSYNLLNKEKNIEMTKAHNLFIKELISVRFEQATGIVIINVFTKEPMLSQLLAGMIINELENRLVEYHIISKQENKEFILNRLSKVEIDLREHEKQYIKFLDSNMDTKSSFFKIEKIRLERQMSGKQSILNRLYSELEINESEQMRENQTFLDIIESPTYNESKSYPSSSTALLVSLLISFLIPFALRFKELNN